MTTWNNRPWGYQIGVIVLIFATIVFVISIVSPQWLTYNEEVRSISEERLFAGILIGCRFFKTHVGAKPFSYTRCSFGFMNTFGKMQNLGGWVHAVEVFEILAALILACICIYACVDNCFTLLKSPQHRVIEIVSACAALLAFIFAMVFVGRLRKEVESNVFYDFNWAFYLSVISSVIIIIAAIIISLYNDYIPPSSSYNYSNPGLIKPTNLLQPIKCSNEDYELYDPRIMALSSAGHLSQIDF